MKERDYAIDALRMVGVFCIILAHISPNAILFDLRNFDVVCMVMIMGMSYYISSQNSSESGYFQYLFKRFKRLVVPTWIFLTLFFVIFNFLGKWNDRIGFDSETYKTSYLLISGIGYVWIIKVYLLIAIISPGIQYISRSISRNLTYMIFLLAWFFAYQFFILKTSEYKGIFEKADKLTGGAFYTDVWLYLLGFGLIAAIGYRYKQFKRKERIGLILVCIACFFGFIIKNGYVSTQQYKYPPQLYYISYGVMVTLILYEIFSIKKFERVVNNKVVAWFSKNSLWLYLWHIIPVRILAYYDLWEPIETKLLPRYLFCVAVAIALTLGQNGIKKGIKRIVRYNK